MSRLESAHTDATKLTRFLLGLKQARLPFDGHAIPRPGKWSHIRSKTILRAGAVYPKMLVG